MRKADSRSHTGAWPTAAASGTRASLAPGRPQRQVAAGRVADRDDALEVERRVAVGEGVDRRPPTSSIVAGTPPPLSPRRRYSTFHTAQPRAERSSASASMRSRQ